ncbi:VOC family protein [Luteimonas deserti]|uniref:Glyoxalase/bleomycin resistance/extradiol dioxygenase family protein n=1 Tax=Luteimonas deserti TaxID=2752306 RepID=A0A7Z0QQB7_9GAMM|nr:VOC family protein [Luteimonas deserti]NYZ61981.1 glyoxalase/bleomycin resistance/extradiol dioxygenase family protein [Luteimonas deserti]
MSAAQIYVNLPVADLDRSVRFFSALGFAFDPRFTDDKATCMIVGDGIFVMLLVRSFFQTFTTRPVCAGDCTEAILCLSRESRAAVDTMVDRARAAGARVPAEAIDHGFMYQHGFEDPDGHLWELMVMDAACPVA